MGGGVRRLRDGGAEREGLLGGLFGGIGEEGEVTHFAAGFGVSFAVEVQPGIGMLESEIPAWGSGMPTITEEIDHGGRVEHLDGTEREVADGAELLFELTRCAGLDR